MSGKSVEQGNWNPPLFGPEWKPVLYEIVEADDPAVLTEKVKAKIGEGYKLIGGPFVAPISNGYGYAYYVGPIDHAFIGARFMQAVCR